MRPPKPLVFEVSFQSPEEIEEAFHTQVSKGGFFIKSEEPAARATPVVVKFILPGIPEPLSIQGEVAFAAGKEAPLPGMGTGMAIQFHQIPPQAERAFLSAAQIARAEGMNGATAATQQPRTPPKEDQAEQREPEPSGEESEESQEIDEESAKSILARLNQSSSENLHALLRALPMHEKIVAAKRGNRAVRNILLQSGNKKILSFLLQNPQMSAAEVVQMLKNPGLPQEIIKLIASNSSWSQSEEIKLQLVQHPKTPLPMALTILPGLNQKSLAKLAKSSAVKHQIKSSALKLLEQRRRGA